MRTPHALLLAVGLAASSLASAASSSLSLTADNGGRWYDLFSAAYGELGKYELDGSGKPLKDINGNIINGFYRTDGGASVGSGGDVFPKDNAWANIGTLFYSTVTNVGIETATITDLDMNFGQYIADNDAISDMTYSTEINNVVGTVSLYNGAITSINLTADVTFTYNSEGVVGMNLPFSGTFSITDSRFSLDAYGAFDVGFGTPFGFRWDFDGAVANLATVPAVPEPSSYAMMLAGLVAVGAMARRFSTGGRA